MKGFDPDIQERGRESRMEQGSCHDHHEIELGERV